MVDLCYIIACLEARRKSYQKAIDMATNKIDWDNEFNWPNMVDILPAAPTNLTYWNGAIAEIDNTLAMLEAKAFKKDIKDGKVNEQSCKKV